MCLQGYRLQTETCRIYVKILICHKEDRILLGRSQTAESRKDNCLLSMENRLELFHEILDDPFRNSLVDIICRSIECRQFVTFIRLGPEEQSPVRWVDSIALIRKCRRNDLGYKRTESGQHNSVIVKNEFLDHF